MSIMWLNDCDADAVATVGGKAVGLGPLIREGFPVPDGFAVTTAAYREAAASIRDQIAICLQEAGTLEGDERASVSIARLFVPDLLGPKLVETISDAYCELVSGADAPVAVRSSATAEDTAEASFAGQQETFLWIRGAEAVTRAILACWASLYTARAIAYRRRFAVPEENLGMGVVVQKMVEADAAGVMMTLEPTTGDRSQIYIESSFGLGEIVVRGEVTPDAFHVAKDPLELLGERITRKTHAYRFDPARAEVVLSELSAAEQQQRSLTAAEVIELAELGRRVEAKFGVPVDLEWAVGRVGGGTRRIALVQARPETIWSRKPVAHSGEAAVSMRDPLHSSSEPGVHWTTVNLGEAIPGVQTPLSWSLWDRAVNQGMREAAFALGVLTPAERRTLNSLGIFYGRVAFAADTIALIGDRLPGTTGQEAVESVFADASAMAFSPTRRRYPWVAWRLPRNFLRTPRRLPHVRGRPRCVVGRRSPACRHAVARRNHAAA